MVEGTCLKEKCYIWREEGDKCPFYLQTMWRDEENPTTSTSIEDCAPRRNTMLLMDYSNRAIGIQQDYSQQKNMYSKVLEGVGEIVTAMEERNKILQEHLGIDYEDIDPKLTFSEGEKDA